MSFKNKKTIKDGILPLEYLIEEDLLYYKYNLNYHLASLFNKSNNLGMIEFFTNWLTALWKILSAIYAIGISVNLFIARKWRRYT